MEKIRLDITKALSFLDPGTLEAYAPQTALEQGTCPGNDFLGWLHLPSSITPEFLDEVQAVADTLRSQCDYVVVAGIGGSYLGARAIIEALGNSFSWLVRDDRNPVILFAGNNIGEDYLYELTTYLKGKRFGVINISKSGTTTETALTFRLLKKQCEAERGKEAAKDVIVAITDAHKGAARAAADKEGYKTFVIPDNVGGRFSVLTPVGLLPIAVAGFDIRQLVAGAQDMEKATGLDVPYCDNIAAQYAAVRNALYQKAGKKIEIMANFQPKLHFVAEWWKQLYGESEGKDHKGIFPASCDFTTDLHSMGQWIQEGERSIWETVLSVETRTTRRTSTASTSWRGSASMRSTRWRSWARAWPIPTEECRRSVSPCRASMPTTSASLSTSSRSAVALVATSSASTPSTSRAWRRIRRICSPCSTNRDMRPRARPSRSV